MSDLTNKDSEQDAKLAVLQSKIESYRERIIALEEETKDVSRNRKHSGECYSSD